MYSTFLKNDTNPFHVLPHEIISIIAMFLIPNTDFLSVSNLIDIAHFFQVDKRIHETVSNTRVMIKKRMVKEKFTSEEVKKDSVVEYDDLGTYSHIRKELIIRRKFYESYGATCIFFSSTPRIYWISNFIESKLENSGQTFEKEHPDPLVKRLDR